MTAIAPSAVTTPITKGDRGNRGGGNGAVRRSGRPGRLEPWLYLTPAFLVLIGLLGYPIFQLVNVSLYDYRQAQVSGSAPLRFTGSSQLRV